MRSSRRLSTGLYVLVAAALVAAGVTWWVKSAPETSAKAGQTGDVVVVQFNNGAVLTYATGRKGSFDGSERGFRQLQQMISSEWPCRAVGAGTKEPNLLDNQGLEYVPQEGLQVIRLPRCSAQSRPGR
jgi:hypothetical protein